ncbi:copper homeostasis protein CutC [Algoriphagus sp. NBT04N3]|jgi:copper homeostasis protein|uniref:copper homeostasis protein CutC n=1 Tax=Algoriphagus sp. NBT04N3 TaxID=2705473 RepID=UPI001C62B192|nr:copper homeostasis protein CutC [Algoriphagus sp. NBT04N3]QYH37571.1 copper homeostasis protein CutC [Algoriphagus sp. NBT04N3]
MSKYLLEAPVFNVQSAIDAAQFGVDRIELCASFLEGGETPSPGMLQFLKEQIKIPIFVMIRPRGGDFCYSPKEIEVMQRDMAMMNDLGADGFVFGALTANGEIDDRCCEILLDQASGKPCTFHRAIDISRDPLSGLDAVIELGFSRVLTSGAKNSVSEGLPMIEKMLEKAGDRIIIMPGGGSKPEHVAQLRSFSNFREIHASCKTKIPSKNQFTDHSVKFSSEENGLFEQLGVDANQVQGFLKAFES